MKPDPGSGRPRSVDRTPHADGVDSFASTPAVRTRMQVQRVRDTRPELAVRRLLHADGLRFRVDRAPLPGLRRRADIVFTRQKVAVFIDGCFWHSCPEHGNLPRSNEDFWRDKLAANTVRDADTNNKLEEAGWRVLRFWEHQDPAAAADVIAEEVRR